MQHPQTKKSGKYLALAFGVPMFAMLLVMLIAGAEPFGNGRSMLYSDMYHQYYPFFVAFREALNKGQSLLYTWSVGLGMDYLALISYYLASPLNLLAAVLPSSLTLEYFALLMPIKLGLASLFFAIFLKHVFHRSDLSISLFGSFYGLCAWALGYQWNVMWLDTFALLPLMALGTLWLLRDKKPALYTIVLFLSVFSNYYVGFFVCIFVALLFFCYEICCCQRAGRFFLDLGRIFCFTVLAIGMTAILELPAFMGLQNTQSAVNAFPQGFKLNIASENTFLGLLQAMVQVASNTMGGLTPTFKEGLPNLYCGVGTVVLVVLFCFNPHVKLREKLCGVFLLIFFMLSFILRQLDYIWHGFHFTNMIPYRFSFLFSFVALYMAYRAWTLRSGFRWWQIALSGAFALVLLFGSESIDEPLFWAYNLLFLGLYVGILLFGLPPKPVQTDDPQAEEAHWHQVSQRRKLCTMLLCGVMALELGMNTLNFGLSFSYTSVTNYPKGGADMQTVVGYMEYQGLDDGFYRAETTHSQTLNDGALNGYHGVSTFTSSANVRVTEFMQALGFAAKNTYNRYCFEEASPVANLFLNLKYMIERDGQVEDNPYFTELSKSGTVSLLENNAWLPLGFLADQTLEQVDFSNTGAFSLQNELFRGATGLTDAVWHELRSPQVIGSEVTLTSTLGTTCQYEDAQSGSFITYTFTADRPGLMCVHLNVTDRNSIELSCNGTYLYSESLTLPQMLSVCQVEAGDQVEVKLKCKSGEDGRMTVLAAVLDEEVFRQGYDVLNASTLELTRFTEDYFCGTIDCDRDGLMYTSVPQDGNWSVTVDGQTVEPVLVGDAMIAVPLSRGSHSVEFQYTNAAFELGWRISAVCAVVFAATLLIPRLLPGKKGKFQK